jgi:hypothetical protein
VDQRGVVRCADHSGAVLVCDAAKQPPDRSRVRLVEAGSRLVGEQDAGTRGERASDRDALPLAGGETVGSVIEPAPEADFGKRVRGRLPGRVDGAAHL